MLQSNNGPLLGVLAEERRILRDDSDEVQIFRRTGYIVARGLAQARCHVQMCPRTKWETSATLRYEVVR